MGVDIMCNCKWKKKELGVRKKNKKKKVKKWIQPKDCGRRKLQHHIYPSKEQ